MDSIIGVYGLGVMGQSLALNLANHHYAVSVYNKDFEITHAFIQEKITNQKVRECQTVEAFLASLKKPRRVFMMVTAGVAVDLVIDQLLVLMEEGDILMDGGNSHYQDTIRRHQYCLEHGIHFFGVGVSGGEKGALLGPSIMPSGNKQVYHQYLQPIFNDIAAKTEDNEPCCHYIGPNGSGHYVKMVHNGIEYADIQIICEAYQILKEIGGLTNDEIQQVFEQWNQGRLKSYLIEITAKILKVRDEKTQLPLVDMILDTAGQKGTGKWTSMEGLDKGVAIPTIAESVFARCLSFIKEQRVLAAKQFDEKPQLSVDCSTLVCDLEKAVYSAKILSYAQGFALLKEASIQNNWQLNYGQIALLWRQGCIIRAEFLKSIKEAFDQEPDCANLMMSESFRPILKKDAAAFRKTVVAAIGNGIYIPALSSALMYYDGYRSERLPANLLQAQRDFFGAHTYQRMDAEANQSFHTQWESEDS